MKNIRVAFMGTPQIAATLLENIIQSKIEVGLVVTQPDKKRGRKQVLVFNEVKKVAVENGIEVFQPVSIKKDFQKLIDFKPDIIITCAYGQIVPEEVLNCCPLGCVNLHGSLLPSYRGGAPIQRAIWNGDKISGMSLMKMVRQMDAGPVLDVEEVDIQDDDNSTSIFEKMAIAASDLLIRQWDTLTSGEAQFIEQDPLKVSFAPIIKKEEERINLSQSDLQICNQIRALSYEPGAYVMVKNKKFKILKAHYKECTVDQPFTFTGLVEGFFGLNLKEGILLIEECQMEGKPVLKGKDFYNGMGRNLVGYILE